MPERMIIEKFGGGGSQNAESILQNVAHIQSESDMAAVVFSGPGGLSGRATERIIGLTSDHAAGGDLSPMYNQLEAQFSTVAPKGTEGIVNATMDDIRDGLNRGFGYEWLRARPEFFMRDVYAHLLREAGVAVEVVNPAGSIYADAHGRLNIPRTIESLSKTLSTDRLNLVPGFAAMKPDWTMTNISRGSTDPVAAVTARAVQQQHPDAQVDFVLRKDDVPGYLRVSPTIRPQAAIASELSIPEAETLALGGSEVVHPLVMSIIDGSGVRLLVRNTFDHDQPGTTIVPRSERQIDLDHPVAGIACKPVVAYKWQEATTDALPGSIADVSGVFKELNVPITEVQSGSGGVIRVYIDAKAAKVHGRALEHALESLNGPSVHVEIENNLELVVLAGEALRDSGVALGVAGKIQQAAKTSKADINGFWSNGNEPNLYVAVNRDKTPAFVGKLYDSLF